MKKNINIRTKSEAKIKIKDIKISADARNLKVKSNSQNEDNKRKDDSPVQYALRDIENKAYAVSAAALKAADKAGKKNTVKTKEKIKSSDINDSKTDVNSRNDRKSPESEYKRKNDFKEDTAYGYKKDSTEYKRAVAENPYKGTNAFHTEESYAYADKKFGFEFKNTIRAENKAKDSNNIKYKSMTDNVQYKNQHGTGKDNISNTVTFLRANTVQYPGTDTLQQKKSYERIHKTAECAKVKADKIMKNTNKMLQILKKTAAKTYKAVTGLISTLIAGGWTAAVLIIIICITAAVLTSFYGIFFSNDTGAMTAHAVILEINEEYENEIEKIKSKEEYDQININGSRAGWKDILAVYAVKMTTSKEIKSVAEFTDENIELLKNVFWDMNEIKSSIKKYYDTEVKTYMDEDGNKVEEITKTEIKILTITLNGKNADEAAKTYSFNNTQTEFLSELLDSSNDGLWCSLIYNTGSNGSIDISSLTFENESANEIQKKLAAVASNSASYGISSKSGYCQAWVADVYEAVTGKRGSAHCALCAADKYSVSTDFSGIKIGAAVYGYASNPYGHVGIYIGGGMVIHNLNGRIVTQSLDSWITQFKGFAWGWENNQDLSGQK